MCHRVIIDCGESVLEGTIPEGADLDGRFPIWEADTGEKLYVNGWLLGADDIEYLD